MPFGLWPDQSEMTKARNGTAPNACCGSTATYTPGSSKAGSGSTSRTPSTSSIPISSGMPPRMFAYARPTVTVAPFVAVAVTSGP